MTRQPDYRRAEDAALRLLYKHDICTPPIDPEEIAESEGIDVVYATFSDDFKNKVSGFIDFDEPRIYINSDIPTTRKMFTIAHELGHWVLHKDDHEDYQPLQMRSNKYEDKPVIEKEADAFAANLLVPTNLLKRYIDKAPIEQIANVFLVSRAVIGHRMSFIYGD